MDGHTVKFGDKFGGTRFSRQFFDPQMSLKPNDVKALQPSLGPYKVSDGNGLYVQVFPDGRKYWRFRYRRAGKQNTLSCGVYPETGLKEARARCAKFRRLMQDGIDPGAYAKEQRAHLRDEQARQVSETRFMLDSHGALMVRLGRRTVSLSPEETAELRRFLADTRAVGEDAHGTD